MKKSLYFFALVLICSCEKDEVAIEKADRGGLVSAEINLQSNANYSQFNYHNQVFFNIDNNIVVKESLKTNWDIAFESTASGWRIILNSSKFCDVVELEGYTFDNEISLSEINPLTKRWDRPEGINYDYGTAIGDYRNKNSVYVINRGLKLDGTEYDKKKLFVEEVNELYYNIRYSDLNNSNIVNKIIYKDDKTNFQYLSFENDSVIDIEPDKSEWDIVFTQYTHLFESTDPVPSYLVTGVLTNYLQNITVAKDTSYFFEEISYDNLNEFDFSNNQDQIGYNWKEYSLGTSTYIVNSATNYIIKNRENKYFKLRFIDFYNSSGQKGYPTFEFQEL